MVNYQNGKIYKIINSTNDKCYIGSTTQKLCVRMAKHRHDYKIGKSCSSKMLFSEDYDNCKIILIENYPCDNKEQLHKQERCWVEKYDCVNKNIPSRTLKEYQKEYYQENKVKLNNIMKTTKIKSNNITKTIMKKLNNLNSNIIK